MPSDEAVTDVGRHIRAIDSASRAIFALAKIVDGLLYRVGELERDAAIAADYAWEQRDRGL